GFAVRASRSRAATQPWYQPDPEWSRETIARTVPAPSQSTSQTLRSVGPTSVARPDARSTEKSRRRASPGRRITGSGSGPAPFTARALQSRPYEPGSAASTSSRAESLDHDTDSAQPSRGPARTGSPPSTIVYGS